VVRPALRLPLSFDAAGLAADLETCLAVSWPEHFNQRDYAGLWTSLALRSRSGSELDIASIPGETTYRDTPILDRCPCFRTVLDSFSCDKESVRLLRLGAGSVIREHRDPGAAYSDGFFRVHVPITTNAETRFVVGGERLQMGPGECWYANFSLPHSVVNEGSTDRVHLVIDGLRNAWSDALFAEAGYDFEAERAAKALDPVTTRQVIEALRGRGTEVDLRLADDLERQLADR
jgi:hypothetical protein